MTRAPLIPPSACYVGNCVGQESRTFSLPGGAFRPRREEVMKAIHSMIAALGLAVVLPATANAATTDTEVIVYRFPGVLDDGSAGQAGVATSFHCTNFSGAVENVRIVVRNFDGTIKANVFFPIGHLATKTASTHSAVLYTEDQVFNTGAVNQGTAAIAATSLNIICTAVTINASSSQPNGFALRGIRFNPIPGSQE